MDNAKDESQVEPLIPPAGCALLVTSSQYFILPGLFTKSLETLRLDDSCKLLLAIAPRIGEVAQEIARLCGYLPLTLRLALVIRVQIEDPSAEIVKNWLAERKVAVSSSLVVILDHRAVTCLHQPHDSPDEAILTPGSDESVW
jgi:hypothetical protein